MSSYTVQPVGFIRSTLKRREEAPRQGPEGAPDAWLEIQPQFAEALLGVEVRRGESVLWRIGHELIVITWLYEVRRDDYKFDLSSSQALTKWHTLQSVYL
jgi:tRNA (Thr-GGU) A37 N-methylase